MKKYLVIGCGGSGAMTQAYMMDQLLSNLKEIDPERTTLPAAWQFVSIDVPTEPEMTGSLKNVRQAGGTYISIGSHQSYSQFDEGLSTVLGRKGVLGEIATWAERHPESNNTNIAAGAGQFRALGRMMSIQKIREIRDGLNEAVSRMNESSASAELNELTYKATGKHGDAKESSPVVFVISSMAGGAGASMFLDVCRLVGSLDNLNGGNTAVFLYTPEIFGHQDTHAMSGVQGNSLAVFGEAMAAQLKADSSHDKRLFEAMGVNVDGKAKIFDRLFPIGAAMGTEAAKFGKGEKNAIYRGMARTLAALMSSEKASTDFVGFTMTNPPVDSEVVRSLGWGSAREYSIGDLAWGSLGYARVSLGRDKYAEYSAQRLARSAFEQLLYGHVDRTQNTTDKEQLESLLNLRLPEILRQVFNAADFLSGMPTPDQTLFWLKGNFNDAVARFAQQEIQYLRNTVPNGEGQRGRDWAGRVRAMLGQAEPVLRSNASSAAYQEVFLAADEICNQTIDVVERELSRYGIPFSSAVVQRVATIFRNRVIPSVKAAADSRWGMNPAVIPAEVERLLSPLSAGKGAVHNSAEIADQIAECYRPQLEEYFVANIARNLAPVLDDFCDSVLDRLDRSLNLALSDLHTAEKNNGQANNLADVATEDPVAWPKDGDEMVGDRFQGADNDIVLATVQNFGRQYEEHLVGTARVDDDGEGIPNFETATKHAAKKVIIGQWNTQSAEKAPNNTLAPKQSAELMVRNRCAWVSKYLLETPDGESRESRVAQFDIKLSPADLLRRARTWIARPGYQFEQYTRVSLRDYVRRENAANDAQYQERVHELRRAFISGLEQARPLAVVDKDLLSRIHNEDISYNYTFSDVPFEGQEIGNVLRDVLESNSKIGSKVSARFDGALDDNDKVKAIDIFGSYPNYSPLVYASLFAPISKEWDRTVSNGTTEGFWKLRRSRPLAAALPLSEEERQAMVAGWLIGLATGRIVINRPGTTAAAAFIFDDETEEWVPFPNPMLTPPTQFIAEIDWMPAVIESVLIGFMRAQSTNDGGPMASLRPYHLLRGLYDNGSKGPTTGGGIINPAVQRLAEFLRTGDVLADKPLGDSIEGRKSYLQQKWEGALKNANYFIPTNRRLRPGEQAVPKPFATVTKRADAQKMPFYRDFAGDVDVMARRLLGLLDEAEALANRPVQAGPSMNPGMDLGGLSRPASSQEGSPLPDFGGGFL